MKKAKIYLFYRKTRRKGHVNYRYNAKTLDCEIARKQFFL